MDLEANMGAVEEEHDMTSILPFLPITLVSACSAPMLQCCKLFLEASVLQICSLCATVLLHVPQHRLFILPQLLPLVVGACVGAQPP